MLAGVRRKRTFGRRIISGIASRLIVFVLYLILAGILTFFGWDAAVGR